MEKEIKDCQYCDNGICMALECKNPDKKCDCKDKNGRPKYFTTYEVSGDDK